MSQKPALKQPAKATRPSGPAPAKSSTNVAQAGTKQTNTPDTKPATSSNGSGLAVGVAEQYASDLLRKASSTASKAVSADAGASDTFKIGDCVWVGGTKPGVIAFMGETKFAAGEWAGVILDALQGKNDGSVAGIRYFTCEPLRGVFAKPAKLTRHPVAEETSSSPSSGLAAPVPGEDTEKGPVDVDTVAKKAEVVKAEEAESKSPDATCSVSVPASELRSSMSQEASEGNETLKSSDSGTPTGATSDGGGGGFTTPTQANKVPKTAAQSKPISRLPKSSFGSTTSLNQLSLAGSSVNIAQVDAGDRHNLKVGDKVIVSGNKKGTLRYVGTTQFAEGEWAGVELDDALGKNDGSVGGKRYFKCVPMFGLFAPVAKVTRLPVTTSTPRRLSTSTSTSSRVPVSTLAASRERSGSQESISSLSSVTSSASRTRASKLRLVGTTSVTDSAIQKALKEKEEHVEQLLMERDLERSEVARTAAHAEEVESKMASLSVQYERLLAESEEGRKKLLVNLEDLEKEKSELVIQLEDEKRKVEDLQFTIEEASIDKGDLESQTESDARKLREMTVQLEKQTQRANRLYEELSVLKTEQAQQTLEVESKAEVMRSAPSSASTDEELKMSTDDRLREYMEQLKVLNEKLKEKEVKEREVEMERTGLVEEVVRLTSAVTSKGERVTDLETALFEEKKNLLEMNSQLEQQMQELSSSEAVRKKHEQNIEELMSKLVSSETTTNSLYADITKLNAQIADLELQVLHNGERCHHLEQDNSTLEHRMSDLMNNAGDSSQQLKIMTDQLQVKDRRVSELETELSTSAQKVVQLNTTISTQLEEMEKMKLEIAENKEHMEKLEITLKEKETQEAEHATVLAKLKEQEAKERDVLMEEKEEEMACKQEELDKIKSELGQVMAKLEAAEADRVKESKMAEDMVKELKMEVEQQKINGEESKNMISSLELKTVKLSEDLAKTSAVVVQLTETERDLKSVKVTLESRVDEMQDSMSRLEKEKNELQVTMENKEKDLMESISRLEKEKNDLQTALISETEDRQQRILQLEEEKSKFHVVMDNQEKNLKEAISQLELEKSETLATMECKENDLKQAILQLESDKSQLKEALDKRVAEQAETLVNLEQAIHEKAIGAAALKEADRKIAHLSQQVDALTKDLAINKGEVKEIEEVRKMLEEEKEKEIAQIQKELEQARLEIDQVKADLESAKAGHQKTVEKAEENLKKLTAELEQLKELKNKVSSLDLEKMKLNEDLTKASAEVERLSASQHDLESAKVTLESEVKRLQEGISSLGEEKEELQVALESKEKETLERLSKLEKEKTELQVSSESKVVEMKGNISRLEKERNDLQLTLENKEKELVKSILKLEKEKNDLQVSVENIEKEMLESSSNLDKVANELEMTFKNREKELLESISRLEKEKNDLHLTSENKEKELIESSSRLEKEKNEVQLSFESKVKDLEESISRLEKEKNDLHLTLENKEKELIENSSRLEKEKNEVQLSFESKVKDLEERISRLEKEKNDLHLTLENKEKELIESSSRLEKEKNEVQLSFESKVKDLEESISRLEKEKNDIHVILEKSSVEKDEAIANVGAVTQEKEAAINALEESNTKLRRLSQQVDALTKDLAINKGEVKEIEEVRKMLEEEKEKVIAQRQEELEQVRSEMYQVNDQLQRVRKELDTTKADGIVELEKREEHLGKLSAELIQLRANCEESKNAISLLESEKVKLNKDLAKASADLDRLSTTERDLENAKVMLDSKVKEMQDNISSLEKEKSEMQVRTENKEKDLLESISRLTKDKNETQMTLESKVKDLEETISVLKRERSEFESTLDSGTKDLQESISRLEEEKSQLQQTVDRITTEKEEALTALKKISHEKESKSDGMKEFTEKIVSLSEQINVKESELAAGKEIISQLTNQLKTVETQSTDRSEETETFKKKIADLEKTCETLTLEKQALRFQGEKILSLKAEKKRLSSELTSLENQMEEISRGNQKKMDDMEMERDSLIRKMEGYMVDGHQKTSMIERLHQEVAQLTADKSRNHNNIQKLEGEISLLQKRILQLESTTKVEPNANRIMPTNVSSSESNAVQLQEDLDDSRAQIDFLNSVIVDIQQKNEEIQAKLDAVMANGFSETASDLDISATSVTMLTSKVPPRLFCDICDMFDLHDTDDCPKQAMSSPDSPPPSMHHGNRNEERLYCDICEVFGHSTKQCDDEQTF